MKGHNPTGTAEDWFARFDTAYEQLEGDLDAAGPAASQPAPASLAEFDRAFDEIDRQMAGQDTESRPESQLDAWVATETALVARPAPPPSEAAPALRRPRFDDELWQLNAESTPLETLVGTVHNLACLRRALGEPEQAAGLRARTVLDLFARARQVSVDFELPTAKVRADFALAAAEDGCVERLDIEIAELVRHIRHDLQGCSIWPIARERVWAFSNELDERVHRHFPGAVPDMVEGGRCLGFGCHDAAVFHLVRASRIGLRALGRALSPRRSEGTEHRIVASTLQLIDAHRRQVSRWPAGADRDGARRFFDAIAAPVRALEDAERRLETHAATDAFDEAQASAVWRAARDLLTTLADRGIDEHGDGRLTKRSFLEPLPHPAA